MMQKIFFDGSASDIPGDPSSANLGVLGGPVPEIYPKYPKMPQNSPKMRFFHLTVISDWFNPESSYLDHFMYSRRDFIGHFKNFKIWPPGCATVNFQKTQNQEYRKLHHGYKKVLLKWNLRDNVLYHPEKVSFIAN